MFSLSFYFSNSPSLLSLTHTTYTHTHTPHTPHTPHTSHTSQVAGVFGLYIAYVTPALLHYRSTCMCQEVGVASETKHGLRVLSKAFPNLPRSPWRAGRAAREKRGREGKGDYARMDSDTENDENDAEQRGRGGGGGGSNRCCGRQCCAPEFPVAVAVRSAVVLAFAAFALAIIGYQLVGSFLPKSAGANATSG